MLDFGQGKTRRLRHALITTTILASGLAAPVYAQIDAQQGPPPTEVTTDGNGVDLVRGKLTLGRTVAAVGGTSGGMAYVRNFTGDGWRDNWMTAAHRIGSDVTISIGASSERFTVSGTTYTAAEGQSSTLVTGPSAGQLKFTAADGTVVIFGDTGAGPAFDANLGRAITVAMPDGETHTFTYKALTASSCIDDACTRMRTVTRARLQSVSSLRGYQVHFDYQSNTAADIVELSSLWLKVIKVTTFNMGFDYCAPSADTCTFSQSWPHVSYAVTSVTPAINNITETDALGRATRYTQDEENPFHFMESW